MSNKIAHQIKIQNFPSTTETTADTAPYKLGTFVSRVSFRVYEYIEDFTMYKSAINTMEQLCVETSNEILAKNLLSTCQQMPSKSLDKFL